MCKKKKSTLFLLFLSFALSVQAQNNFLHFDGSEDFVVIPENGDQKLTGDITLEAMIYMESIPSNMFGYTIMDFESSGWRGFMMGIEMHNNNSPNTRSRLNFVSQNNDADVEGFTYSNTDLSANTWYHVAIVRNTSSNTLSFYINGVLDRTRNSAGNILQVGPNNDFYIGGQNGGLRNFAGYIDEVRLWNVARTEQQINQGLGVELTGSEPGLVSYYQFNEGECGGDNTGVSAPEAGDSAGSNNGTLLSFAKNGCTSNYVCSGPTCNISVNELVVAFPIPTISEWGLIILSILLLTIGVITLKIKNKQYSSSIQ